MQKKYQIFISSTFKDLVDERQDAMRSVLDLGHIPAGMEIFPAADTEQFEYIKKVIDECDYYILIIGARYGSVDEAGMSFTEKEYHYAFEKGIPVLVFPHGDVGSIATAKSDTDSGAIDRLNAFRAVAVKGRIVRFWKTREELKHKVAISLANAIVEYPGNGWVRASRTTTEDAPARTVSMKEQPAPDEVAKDEEASSNPDASWTKRRYRTAMVRAIFAKSESDIDQINRAYLARLIHQRAVERLASVV